MITIKNKFLQASFQTLGAELKSLIFEGREYIWEGRSDIWANSCPTMFPICGGLIYDEYVLDGKTYHMKKHGFAKNMEFSVEKQSESSVTFLLKSNGDTKEMYPYDFELRIIYTLDNQRLGVRYEVTNLSGDTMYFSIGAHEGYATPEGIEEYEILFPQKEDLYTFELDGNILTDKKVPIMMNADVLPLKKDYFVIDALVCPEVVSRSVILSKKDGTRALRVEFDGFFNLMLWQKCGAPYICIEPWNGIPDRPWSNGNLKEKEGIQQVSANSTYVRTHTIEIIK